MKKLLICIVLALVLTIPVSLGIMRMPWFWEWFNTGSGWEVLNPALKAVGSVGGEQDYNVLYEVLLIVGFMISMVISTLIVTGVSHMRRKHLKP